MSGPGGVGKSHVIRLIQSDTIKLLKLSGMFEPGDVIVLLTAPTGVAAFNISGMTLHSALLLGRTKFVGFQPLSNKRLNTLRHKLSKIMLIIIDEVSMVGSNTLLEINKGGVSVQTRHIDLLRLSNKRSDTGGLHAVLKLL